MSHQRIRLGSNESRYPLFASTNVKFPGCSAVRTGDLVYLTGATGVTLGGKEFVGKGDPAAQAENAMLVVANLLKESGASIRDICKVTTYVTDYAYRAKVYPVIAKHLKGVYPCSTGLVVSGLARPELDFEIDVFTVIPQNDTPHLRLRTFNKNIPATGDPSFPSLDYGLSRVVRAGNMVFLQGQTGRSLEGGFVGRGNPAAQADKALGNVKILLEDAGVRMEDICKIITYVKEHSHRNLVYPVLAKHLRGIGPVSTGLVVSGFGLPEVDFEIDVFAVAS